MVSERKRPTWLSGAPRFRGRLRLDDGTFSDRFELPEGLEESEARAYVASLQAREDETTPSSVQNVKANAKRLLASACPTTTKRAMRGSRASCQRRNAARPIDASRATSGINGSRLSSAADRSARSPATMGKMFATNSIAHSIRKSSSTPPRATHGARLPTSSNQHSLHATEACVFFPPHFTLASCRPSEATLVSVLGSIQTSGDSFTRARQSTSRSAPRAPLLFTPGFAQASCGPLPSMTLTLPHARSPYRSQSTPAPASPSHPKPNVVSA